MKIHQAYTPDTSTSLVEPGDLPNHRVVNSKNELICTCPSKAIAELVAECLCIVARADKYNKLDGGEIGDIEDALNDICGAANDAERAIDRIKEFQRKVPK